MEGNKMNNLNKSRAKEIFEMFLGSFYHMDREGLYDEFESYKIDETTIKNWRIDMWEREARVLRESFDSVSFSRLCNITMNISNFDYFLKFFDILENNLCDVDLLYRESMLLNSSNILKYYSKNKNIDKDILGYYKYRLYLLIGSIDLDEVKEINKSKYTRIIKTKENFINGIKSALISIDSDILL